MACVSVNHHLYNGEDLIAIIKDNSNMDPVYLVS